MYRHRLLRSLRLRLWLKRFGGFASDYAESYAQDVTTDHSNNIYIAGYIFGSLPGSSSAGLEDIFIAKYDSSGTQSWIEQFGTSTRDYATSIATDSSGNAYIGGIPKEACLVVPTKVAQMPFLAGL